MSVQGAKGEDNEKADWWQRWMMPSLSTVFPFWQRGKKMAAAAVGLVSITQVREREEEQEWRKEATAAQQWCARGQQIFWAEQRPGNGQHSNQSRSPFCKTLTPWTVESYAVKIAENRLWLLIDNQGRWRYQAVPGWHWHGGCTEGDRRKTTAEVMAVHKTKLVLSYLGLGYNATHCTNCLLCSFSALFAAVTVTLNTYHSF